MRESIDAEIPTAKASCPADIPAAIRRALTCAPLIARDRLRAAGARFCRLVGDAEAGSRTARTLGSGDGSNVRDI